MPNEKKSIYYKISTIIPGMLFVTYTYAWKCNTITPALCHYCFKFFFKFILIHKSFQQHTVYQGNMQYCMTVVFYEYLTSNIYMYISNENKLSTAEAIIILTSKFFIKFFIFFTWICIVYLKTFSLRGITFSSEIYSHFTHCQIQEICTDQLKAIWIKRKPVLPQCSLIFEVSNGEENFVTRN